MRKGPDELNAALDSVEGDILNASFGGIGAELWNDGLVDYLAKWIMSATATRTKVEKFLFKRKLIDADVQ